MKWSVCFFIFFSVVSFSLSAQTHHISEIQFKGLKHTKSAFITQFLETKKGEALDSVQIQSDIIRLKRLSSISNVTYEVAQLPNKQYKLTFNFEENFTLIPVFNYWTTITTIAYKIGGYEYNLFGKNITFGGFYQYNGQNTFGLNFNAPYLFSNKWGLDFNFLNLKSEELLYIGDQSTIYLYQNSSYELLGSYQLNFKNRVQLGLSLFSEHYKATKDVTSLNLPNEVETNKQLIKLIYTHQNLDYYYFYIQGFKSVFNGQFVTTNNTAKNNFFIAWNDFLYYKRVGARGNWAKRLRLGLSTNNESPFAPFSLDNNINLRGVGNAVDRGAGSIVFNTEYRYTLVDKKNIALQSNGFIDVGSWRTPGKSLRTFADSENIQVYSGVGFRLIHKKIANFNFRIDYGYGLTKNANRGFVFGIGQYF
jgi:outer membrane protein assembly factor BamA